MQDDRSALSWPALAVLGLVMVGWGVWFFQGKVRVYAVAQSARTEVDQLAHAVQSPVAGVVSESRLELGKYIKKGDVLLVLDAMPERLQLAQEEAKLKGQLRMLAVLEKQLEAEREAKAAQAAALGAAVGAAAARGKVVRTVQEQAAAEDQVMKQLRADALATGMEALKSASELKKQQAEALAAQFEVGRVAASGQTEQKDRAVQVVKLEHEVTSLQADIELSAATVTRFEHEIERRTIRAAVDGVVADMSPAPAGTMLAIGQKIAVLVPQGSNQVVARFAPAEAIGRVKPGQQAIVRLDAFPWTEYGVLKARVHRVAHEPQDGVVRTELDIASGNDRIPLGHGLTGSVEIELEETSPFRLLLRVAGQLSAPAAEPPPEQPTVPSASLR